MGGNTALLSPEKFIIENQLLYRTSLSLKKRGKNDVKKQLVVPVKYREQLFKKAHSDMFGGHMGTTRTKQRINHNFYWPGMGKQIKVLVRGCDVCQRLGPSMTKPKLN